MASLQRIQERIDAIAPLLREIDELRPVTTETIGGFALEPSYSADALNDLRDNIQAWKAATTEVLAQEFPNHTPEVDDFNNHWRAPQRAYDYKTGKRKQLQRARTDLRIILAVAKEQEQIPVADIWALIHPSILPIARSRMEDGYYADAVEAACKELNARVREIVKAKTGEELDGARLMQKAFSVESPIIRLSKETTQSARDTQQGYMQIFSGVMTGIRNPKAHDNETITREDALRKLTMLSILMYKIDEATVL